MGILGSSTTFVWHCFIVSLAFQASTLLAQCNTPPNAIPDTAHTPDNRPLWIAPLANDSDPDGQKLVVTVDSEDCPGTVNTPTAGLLLYTPSAIQEVQRTCSIHYSIADGAGGTDSTVVHVTVNKVLPEIFADDFESGDTSAWLEEQANG